MKLAPPMSPKFRIAMRFSNSSQAAKSVISRHKACLIAFAGSLLSLYAAVVAYFYLNSSDDVEVDDESLLCQPLNVPDDENKFVAYLAMTNEVVFSDDACFLMGLHNVATLPSYRGSASVDMPLFGVSRSVSKRFGDIVDGLYECGEYEKAVLAICDHYSFASSCRDNASTAVEEMIGCELCTMTYWKIVKIATTPDVSDALLAEVARIVRERPDYKSIFGKTLKREYSYFIKPQFCRLDDTAIDLFQETESWLRRVAGDWCGAVAARILINTPGYDRFSYKRKSSLQLIATAMHEADIQGLDYSLEVADTDVFEPNWLGRKEWAQLCNSLFEFLRKRLRYDAMSARFSRIIVALQRYARKHEGEYPESLGELVPEFLDAVPKDPFDESSEIKYDRGRRIVWSVGENGECATPPVDCSKRRTHEFHKWASRVDGKPWK